MTNLNFLYNKYVQTQISPDEQFTKARLAYRAPFIKNLIKNHFPKSKKASILDLGCGHGAIIYFAQKQGYENLKGFDFSQQQVDMAHKLGLQDLVSCENLFEIIKKYPDSSIDLLITFDVLEHMSKTEILNFALEANRVIKPSGKWMIHVPNGASPFGCRAFGNDFTHKTLLTPKSAKQILKAFNFSSIKIFEDRPIVHGLKSAIRRLLWLIIRNILRAYLLIEQGLKNEVFSQNMLIIASNPSPLEKS